MKLSVIVPYYKGEQYLKDCIAGIREGGYEDVEILICDDDPMDPRGVAHARNSGIERMTGDYCLFIDSDDYLLPGALGRAMKSAATHSGAIIELPILETYFCRNTVMNGSVGDDIKLTTPFTGFRDSVVGLLIPAALIKGRTFNTGLRYYSDYPMVAYLKSNAEYVTLSGTPYYKRIHNDPVNLPSLSQEKSKVRQLQFCNAVTEALNVATNDSVVRKFKQLFIDNVIDSMTKGHNPAGWSWSVLDYAETAKLFREYPDMQGLYTGSKGKLLKRIASGDSEGAVKLAKKMNFKLLKKGPFGSKNQWLMAYYRKLAMRKPVNKNLVFFESFNAKSYGDSPRYIYEEYLERGLKDKRFVWSIEKGGRGIPGSPRLVRPGTLKYLQMLATAGTVITNMRQPDWFVKRDGQFLLETWHGTPLKKLVFDMEDVYTASPDYKKIFYNQSRKWDYLLSGNSYSTDIFARAFMFPKERILELGYPRNDSLVKNNNSAYIEALKEKLHIPRDKKIVLYAPTWRDDEFKGKGSYRFKLPFTDEFARKMKDEYYFILRLHYFVSDRLELTQTQSECMVDMSSYDDINELYLLSDILVTDYSSVFFDYAVLKKPMLFYAYDYERYRDTLRGFYFDMESYCPGPVLHNEDELANALGSIEELAGMYAERYDCFRRVFAGRDDGRASARVVDFIEQHKGGN